MQTTNVFQALSGLKITVLSLVLLLLVVADSRATALSGQIIGNAYQLESEKLLYSESHCLDQFGARRDIYYRDFSGSLLAYKKLDYASVQTTPNFVQHNYYSGESIDVSLDGNSLSMTTTLDDVAGKEKKLSIKPQAKLPLVIDAGFDAFIHLHWDALVAGERKRFLFPVVDQQRLVALRIATAACSYNNENEQCFRLEVDNFFLRILLSPIELGYDRKLKRLSRYRGLSNIGDGDGEGQEVDIRYSYGALPAAACEAAS